jgi:hypothetical protein
MVISKVTLLIRILELWNRHPIGECDIISYTYIPNMSPTWLKYGNIAYSYSGALESTSDRRQIMLTELLQSPQAKLDNLPSRQGMLLSSCPSIFHS